MPVVSLLWTERAGPRRLCGSRRDWHGAVGDPWGGLAGEKAWWASTRVEEGGHLVLFNDSGHYTVFKVLFRTSNNNECSQKQPFAAAVRSFQWATYAAGRRVLCHARAPRRDRHSGTSGLARDLRIESPAVPS